VAETFIVLTRQIVGTSLSDLRCETYWDGEFHPKRQAAKKAGWKERGSDDFNIGVVRDGRLVSVDWMDEPLGESADELADIEEEIGLYEGYDITLLAQAEAPSTSAGGKTDA